MYKVADSYGKGTPEYDKVMATAVRYFPTSPAALNENAVNAISRKEYDKAVQLLERSEVAAQSAELLTTLGVAYAGVGHNLKEMLQVMDQL